MTTQEAVKVWKEIKTNVNYQSLQAKEKHDLVHEVFAAVNKARLSGELTIAQIEAL